MLVSIQAKIIMMEVYDLEFDNISNRNKLKNQPKVCLDKEKILCKHCKRTAKNGIRCMGICVADNEY